MGELYSLLTSRHMLSYLSYTAQDHLAKDGATHSELEFSTSIFNMSSSHRYDHRQA